MKAVAFNSVFAGFKVENLRPAWLLIVGVVLMTLSHLTWNVDFLVWVSMTPFLLFINITKGWKSRITFAFVLILAWSVIVLKITTDPIPYFFIPLYSVPIALIHLPGYLIYDLVKSHRYSVLVFPAMMVLIEWIQYSFTPFASWGVAAYTQSDSIHMIQGVSLFGMAGLSFIIYWTNAALASVFISKRFSISNFYATAAIILLLGIYGHLRLENSRFNTKETIKVAAVGTDSEIGGLPLPSFESNTEVIQAILDRTIKAAAAGARLIVWNEAAFYLTPEKEQMWTDSISVLARTFKVGITASYIVPVSLSPLRYENKLVLFAPDGSVSIEYLKHEPVPGEPAIRGNEEITSVKMFNIAIGGAICYDYDFPYLAKQNNKANVDIVALPSSDWQGIDPLHTKMASFRAVEQGHSIVRSTRFGLSAAINPYGVLVDQQSSNDQNDKILIADLPINGINTVYAAIGDLFIYLNIVFLVIFFSRLVIKRKSFYFRLNKRRLPGPWKVCSKVCNLCVFAVKS